MLSERNWMEQAIDMGHAVWSGEGSVVVVEIE
jgi:hypothetical protein